MRTRVVLPDPHCSNQSILMRAFTNPDLKELWISCGTKWGKTLGASSAICLAQLTMRNGLFRWVAPIYSQSKIGFNYSRKILPPQPTTKQDLQDLSLTVRSLDSRLEFKSGKFGEDLEGEAINGYVLDECAKMSRQVYDSAKTTTAVTEGTIVAISTPRGDNWFKEKCMAAKDEMDWAKQKGINPTKMFITAPSAENPYVSKESIEDARRSLPERLFAQYYLAEFITGGSVLHGFKECIIGERLDFHGSSQLWFASHCGNSIVVIGVDWGKTKDYTVFSAIDIMTRKVVGIQRFYKTPYTQAIRRLVIFSKRFRETIIIKHDRTGLGMVIDDQLSYTDLSYEGVTFTNNSKCEMVTQLITTIEHKMLGLPNWDQLIKEFESFEVKTNALGTMSYNAADGQHDDIVCSLMLANLGLTQYGDDSISISFLDEKPRTGQDSLEIHEELSSVEKFYQDLRE